MQGPDAEALLEAALSESFSPPLSRRQSRITPASATKTNSTLEEFPTPAEASESTSPQGEGEDTWKSSYETQVEAWRIQSAEAREKAEKERARWESLREEEKKKGQPPFSESTSSFEEVTAPSPADSTYLVTSEVSKLKSETIHSRQPTSEADSQSSQKWEHLPSESLMSLPEEAHLGFKSCPAQHPNSQPVPLASALAPASGPFSTSPFPDALAPAPAPAPAQPSSATLSIFDPSLSPSTRAKAFVSALAINLLLPFVNGVMLGFGEIFAKNIVLGWFGWRSTSVGMVRVGRKEVRGSVADLGLRNKL